MVQTLARDIHTPHTSGSTGGSSNGNAYEAVATRLAGAMVLTMQDSLVWSLTLPAPTADGNSASALALATTAQDKSPSSMTSSLSISIPKEKDNEEEELKMEEGEMLKEGDVVPVICYVGSSNNSDRDIDHQQLPIMVLSAKVLFIETMVVDNNTATNSNNNDNNNTTTTTNSNDNNAAIYYTVQFLCDHSVERVSQ